MHFLKLQENMLICRFHITNININNYENWLLLTSEIIFYLFLFLKFNNVIDGNNWIANWKEKWNILLKYNNLSFLYP